MTDFVTRDEGLRSTRRERLSKWWHREDEIPFAPWHHPEPRVLASGVTVTTTYGSHVMAALLYAAWKWVRRV